jgi:hypothetical protein
LLILNLHSGKTVSVLRGGRDVRALGWAADDTLDGVMTPPDEGDGDEVHTYGYAFSFVWDDWRRVPDRAFPTTDQFGPVVPYATLAGPHRCRQHPVTPHRAAGWWATAARVG